MKLSTFGANLHLLQMRDWEHFSVKMVGGGGGGGESYSSFSYIEMPHGKREDCWNGGGRGNKIFYQFCVFKMKQFPTHWQAIYIGGWPSCWHNIALFNCHPHSEIVDLYMPVYKSSPYLNWCPAFRGIHSPGVRKHQIISPAISGNHLLIMP